MVAEESEHQEGEMMSKIEELRRLGEVFGEESKAGDVLHDLIRPTSSEARPIP